MDPAKLPDANATSRAVDALHKEVQKSDTRPKPSTTATEPGHSQVKPDRTPSSKPAAPAGRTVPEPDQSKLSEVEKKMDELLALKAARERAAATNRAPDLSTNSAAPAGPKSKRDRLNDLLRLVVEGKITDAEYKEKRSKIVSEPD